MKRLLTALAGITLLAMSHMPAAAHAKDKLDIVMSSTGFPYLPVLVAQEMGYFAEEGIDAGITATGGGSKALAALIGGDAQIVVGPPSSALRARVKGADAIIFGAGMAQFGANIVMSGDWAKKQGITERSAYRDKLKALKGITIGVTSAGSRTDQVVRYLAKDAGLDPNRDVTIIALGTGDAMTAALVQGRIQAFSHASPVGENAVKNHGAIMYLSTSRGEVKSLNGFFYIGQIARESWLVKNRDLAQRYLRAIQKAFNAMHDETLTAKARDAVHEAFHSKTEKGLYDYTWEGAMPAFPVSVLISDKMIKSLVDFMNVNEKEPVDPKIVGMAWTNDYAEKAVSVARK